MRGAVLELHTVIPPIVVSRKYDETGPCGGQCLNILSSPVLHILGQRIAQPHKRHEGSKPRSRWPRQAPSESGVEGRIFHRLAGWEPAVDVVFYFVHRGVAKEAVL